VKLDRAVSTYLNIVNVVAVPVGAEEFVAKSEDQDVLDHLLTKVVVNTEDLLLLPVGLQGMLKLSGAAKILTERLLNLFKVVSGSSDCKGTKH
jgi:hypothetical protein